MEYKDFEDALTRLEAIVTQLEKGELPLEEALQLFEEGMTISQFCNSKLTEAERRVEILLKNKEGRLVEEPFEVKGNEQ